MPNEELLEQARAAWEKWPGSKGQRSIITPGKTLDPLAPWQTAIAIRFAAAFAEEREQRWIPVEDKLPERDWYGLIFTNEGATEVAYFRRDAIGPQTLRTHWELERTGPYDDQITLDLEEVTHWMPLPAPPKLASGEIGQAAPATKESTK